jgi:hypothetical protein
MLMAKEIHVTMPDGSVWSVLASAVADNRASYYAKMGYDDKAEFDETMGDDYILTDWAAGNMNWEDVKDQARIVKSPSGLSAEDFQEGWVNGHKEVVDG